MAYLFYLHRAQPFQASFATVKISWGDFKKNTFNQVLKMPDKNDSDLPVATVFNNLALSFS